MAVQKVFNYSFTPGTRQIDTGIADLTKDHIIKIVNSTTGKTIANPAMMGTIASVVDGVITYEAQTQITLPSGAVKTWTLPPLNAGDILTIEIDSGTPAYRIISDEDLNAMTQRIINQNYNE